MKVGQQAYTELSIQIATLEAKVDKILQLLMKPEVTVEPLQRKKLSDILAEAPKGLFKDLVPVGSSVDTTLVCGVGKISDIPQQWPNESRTDYLKRIGQYVEAYSDNEKFDGDFK